MNTVIIDDVEYDIKDAPPSITDQLANIEYVNSAILQRNNELQIAETAKMGYLAALKREIKKVR